MKQSFFRNTSARLTIFVSIILFFILIANFIYKIVPNKWYVIYKIEPNIKVSISSGIINDVFRQLEFIDSEGFTVSEFVKKQTILTDATFIKEKFPNIGQTLFTDESIGLFTSNLSKIDQELDIIINEIEKDIKIKLLAKLNAFKELAKIKIDIQHNDEIEKKKNEINYYSSKNYISTGRLIFEQPKVDNEKYNSGSPSPFIYKTYDALPHAEFELYMMLKNGEENYKFIRILESIEEQIINTKLIKIGKKLNQIDKSPSRIFLMAIFSIIGLFFGFIFILLTSKISKKLMIKMSSLLLNLK